MYEYISFSLLLSDVTLLLRLLLINTHRFITLLLYSGGSYTPP